MSDKPTPDTIKREIDIFFTALMFLSRLPSPKSYQFEPSYLAQASKYYSAVGIVLALLQLALLALLSQLLPQGLALMLSLALALLISGGLHEDGLADMVDGFGGGYKPEQVLTIMKDSRLGAYGALTLISVLALKFYSLSLLLQHIDWLQFAMVLILGQSLSRALATSLMGALAYVKQENSKVAAMATPQSGLSLLLLGAFSLPFLLVLPPVNALALLGLLALFRQLFIRYLHQRIGGYTGDCLGGAQQIAELLIYFACLYALVG